VEVQEMLYSFVSLNVLNKGFQKVMEVVFPIEFPLLGIARNVASAISFRAIALQLQTKKQLNICGIACNGIAFPSKDQ